MSFLNIRVAAVIVGLSVLLGVLNNFRVPEPNRVSWFGGQPILPKPEPIP